jgi:hypothetical protein
MTSGEWAAWVQAVGSVAAIVAAIWIDQGSARRDREARREARLAALAACSRVVSTFRVKAAAMLARLQESPREDARVGAPVRRGFEITAATLRTYPVADIPNPDAVMLFCDSAQLAEFVVMLLADVDAFALKAQDGEEATVTAWALEHLAPLVAELERNDDALRKLAGV